MYVALHVCVASCLCTSVRCPRVELHKTNYHYYYVLLAFAIEFIRFKILLGPVCSRIHCLCSIICHFCNRSCQFEFDVLVVELDAVALKFVMFARKFITTNQ